MLEHSPAFLQGSKHTEMTAFSFGHFFFGTGKKTGKKKALNVRMSVDDGDPEAWNKSGRSEGQSERSG